ncbi:MAG: putative immunity protein [Bacillota bacterium]
MRKLLFNRESEVLQPLRALIEEQKHRTLVLWAIDCADRLLSLFEENHLDDTRPREALEKAKAWSLGEIKMPIANKAALDAHQAASLVEDDLAACAAARAIGHVVGTVHVETHAMGLVIYGLTAFVRKHPEIEQNILTDREVSWFYTRLKFWESHVSQIQRTWAPFLLRDDMPNKEKQMRIKLKSKNKL